MEFSKNGVSYFITQNKDECEKYYYERCKLIVNYNPNTETSYKEIEKISNIWININYFGCEYSDEVTHKVKQILKLL